jgi:hypothetical protein
MPPIFDPDLWSIGRDGGQYLVHLVGQRIAFMICLPRASTTFGTTALPNCR